MAQNLKKGVQLEEKRMGSSATEVARDEYG